MGGYACDMLHAKVRFALVRSIVARVACVCAFVCRTLATAPSRRKATIVMRTKKESDLPTYQVVCSYLRFGRPTQNAKTQNAEGASRVQNAKTQNAEGASRVQNAKTQNAFRSSRVQNPKTQTLCESRPTPFFPVSRFPVFDPGDTQGSVKQCQTVKHTVRQSDSRTVRQLILSCPTVRQSDSLC